MAALGFEKVRNAAARHWHMTWAMVNHINMETRAERKRRGVWWRNCTTQPPSTGTLHPMAMARVGE
eukprot:4167506-Lingulodinium_polyedra.AAC.1